MSIYARAAPIHRGRKVTGAKGASGQRAGQREPLQSRSEGGVENGGSALLCPPGHFDAFSDDLAVAVGPATGEVVHVCQVIRRCGNANPLATGFHRNRPDVFGQVCEPSKAPLEGR